MAASLCRRNFFNFKNSLFHVQKRTGYVVLIPETPDEISKCNIDSAENLPDFAKLTGYNCNLIVNSLGQQYDVGSWELKQLIKDSENQNLFKYIFDPLEVLSIPYWSAWGVARTLHFSNYNLLPHKKFYPLNDQILVARNNKYNSMELYNACKKMLENESNNFTEEQKRILNKFILEGFMNGFELSDNERINLSVISTKLEASRKTYDEKLKISKEIFRQIIYDKKFVEDCPLDLVWSTSTNSKAPLEGPWVLSLNFFTMSRYLEYCPSRDSRLHLWLSYSQLCSPLGDNRCNATSEISNVFQERQKYAQTLGFKSYAHLAMKNKMAESVEQVQSVLEQLLEPAKCNQEKEIYELEKFAYSQNFKHPLELWDFHYWKRVHLKHEFGIDEKVLRNYFPLNQVLLGLIALCEELFGIVIEEEASVEGWNPNVRYFRIADNKTKQILGGFYLDPYFNEGKIIGESNTGWFIVMKSRSQVCNSVPLSSLIFNFIPPEGDKPSLLYFRDIENLFDKFGQMLQHTLTEMKYSEVSGLSNIEWDAVGVVRYFLVSWLQERGTLESISGHFDTGEPLPGHILDNLCNLKRHMAGTSLCRRIYYANLDLEWHLENSSWKSLVDKLWPKHLLFQLHDLDQHPCGWQDIISGPWAGSYYCDIWSQMLAADIFAAFQEAGFHNQEEIKNLGKRLRSTFLALGGGCDPKEVFRRFRGRDPDPKYLLKFLNLNKKSALPNSQPESTPA